MLHTRVFIVSSSTLAIILNTLPLLFLITSIVGLSFYLNRRVMEAEATTIGVPMFMTGLAGVAISILSLWYTFQNAAYSTIQEIIFHMIEIFEKEKAKVITAMLGDARARAANMAKEAGGGGDIGGFRGGGRSGHCGEASRVGGDDGSFGSCGGVGVGVGGDDG